jgi:peptide/nickel transport system permease protein
MDRVMARYVFGRLLQALLTLLVIATVAFALTRLVPGEPARLILGPQHSTPAGLAALRHELGLDRPVLSQYVSFVAGAVRFHFGESIHYRQPVSSVLVPDLWPTLWLVFYACVLSVAMVVPLALIAATHRNRLADHAIRLASTLGYATPAFLIGLLLILIFGVGLEWLPVEGYGSGVGGHLRSLTLPALTIALSFAPFLLRTLRSGLLDTLGQEFIEAARARGLSARRVLMKHAMRNSVLPTLTILGLSLGALLSANVIVENVFAIPGLGSLLVTSVSSRDYPMIQALVVLFAAAVVISNLVTDLLYVVVDPRIRL